MSTKHDELVNKFRKMLEENPTTLDLKFNFIGKEGAKALATVLPTSSLTTLNLNCNYIKDEGAKALATALPNSSLTALNLKDNSIEDEGAKALATALPKSSLTRLNFIFNRIGAEGRQQLKKAIFTPSCHIYRTGIDETDKNLKPRRKKFLAAANKHLPNHYVNKDSFNHLSSSEKVALLFKNLGSIKCRKLIIQLFINKNGNHTNTISAFLPVPELLHHILSFVFPALSSQEIAKSWTMAEDKLAEITKKNNTIYEAIDTIQPTRMTG